MIIFLFHWSNPFVIGILVHKSLVTSSELGGTGILLILFTKSFVSLIYDGISLARGCRWWSTKCEILVVWQLMEFITGFPGSFSLCILVKCKTLGGFGLTNFSLSASFLESRFSFLNCSIVSSTRLLSCSVYQIAGGWCSWCIFLCPLLLQDCLCLHWL